MNPLLTLIANFIEKLVSDVETVVEKVSDIFTKGARRKDIETKIKDLEREREFLIKYTIKKNIGAFSSVTTDALTGKIYNTAISSAIAKKLVEYNVDFKNIRHVNKTLEELEMIALIERDLKKKEEAEKKNKNETVVNLFLLNEKSKLLKAKTLSVVIVIASALTVFFFGIPIWSVLIGLIPLVLIEMKDRVITYRVAKGYFGRNAPEAIQLVKFIRENTDKFDSNDSGDGRRKVLNPEKEKNVSADDTVKGWQNA
ncbi:TPA: hypothetical protein R4Z18_003186 [Klebsiella pneumoniae]|uniref:hypothetical protein n=1 Tax=Klebsiella pneumoniae TaxID=573 RepID=UPI000E2BC294|nr:hypothetical protein [Klebsiella pneumoniae]MBG9395017.1 hypothetical protein [Klebsiella pneumoniae]QLQ72719.1 hypothetical protein H1D29_01065 [Klebsiella pneumoniae]CAA1294768.1 Uncharacterised protein [Klebsiella pneumoniae]SVT12427.1 Uncharacterised protein [Klebsiella pneumoniae]SVZ85734.1 Uncharacterised protein [Klebsiella pneumoniae]